MGRPPIDPVDETRRIIAAADAAGIPLRAVGGIGVAMRAPSAGRLCPMRTHEAIDLAGAAPGGRTETLLVALGYEPARPFNAIHGSQRLRFHDRDGRRVDVALGVLRRCHDLPFGDRLTIDDWTLPLADLMLSKLGIVDPTDDDAHDVAALFADHELTDDDAGIGLRRIAAVCANDWGWWKTVDDNLRSLISVWRLETATAPADMTLILGTAVARATGLRDRLASTPKSTTWRLRAVVGERVRWYGAPDGLR